jgi:hypothetical protein
LTDIKLFSILESVLRRETQIAKAIDYLVPFSAAYLQVQFYDYALALLDFDYQSRSFREASATNSGNIDGTFFIIMTDSRISDISN